MEGEVRLLKNRKKYLIFWEAKMGTPRSKAGVRSTSLGTMPLVIRLKMPFLTSLSRIGATANGLSRICFGNIPRGFEAMEWLRMNGLG